MARNRSASSTRNLPGSGGYLHCDKCDLPLVAYTSPGFAYQSIPDERTGHYQLASFPYLACNRIDVIFHLRFETQQIAERKIGELGGRNGKVIQFLISN